MTTIKTVALSKLAPSKENVRRYNSDAGIEALAADISVKGILQNLNVKAAGKGKFEVIAGGRRLKALKHLLKEGGSIQGVKVTKDYPVPVREGATEDVSATEISLSENFQRSAMHPADEIEAFGKLNRDEGLEPEEIAARFGISHMTVRRRLKLANLSPRLLEELRQDKMSLQQAEALALTDDQSRQEETWFKAEYWQRQPYNIKNRLSAETLGPDDKVTQFIREEYLAAGGPVERDLFTPTEEVYLVDKDMAFRLVSEKLERERETILAEGWKWAEVQPDFDYSTSRLYGRVYGEPAVLSTEDQAKHEALTAEQDELSEKMEVAELYGDEDLDDLSPADAALVKRHLEISEQLEALNDQPDVYSDENKAIAGAVLTIAYNGKLKVERGLIRPEDRTAVEGKGSANGAGISQDTTEPETGGLSAALTEDLTAQRSASLALEIAKRPDMALVALVHALALQHFYYGSYDYYNPKRAESAVQIKRELPPRPSKEIEQAPAIVALASLESEWKAKLPKKDHELWDWCLDCSPKVLNNLMAFLVGASLNATQERTTRRNRRHDNADQIARALNFNMAAHWQADSAFFKRTSKAYMAETIIEAAGEDFAKVASGLGKLSKGEAVNATVEAVHGRGWVPQPLRTPETAPVIETEEAGLDTEDEDEFNEAA